MMADEVELARLPMADGSNLVLTNRHVHQRKDSGWRGEAGVSIPRAAITSVSIEWHRNSGFIIGGAIVLLISFVPQLVTLPFALPPFLTPTVALFGVAIMLLSLIKSKSLQITAPNASIGGATSDYEDAEKFCDLLLKGVTELPPAAKNEERAVPSKDESVDSNWQL